MQPVTLAVIGAGTRGRYAYSSYAQRYPHELKIVAVAEADAVRRHGMAEEYDIPPENQFADWRDLFIKKPKADAVLIATQDRMHFEPTLIALDAGYHVLLEKPMSPDPIECMIMVDRAKAAGRILTICHVLRYNAFFATLKSLLDEGRIGKLVSIQHNENVGYWHHAHSFVRGHWRKSADSSPMILAKSCHDTDVMLWLARAEPLKVSSFGSLSYFRKENAPPGATQRCTDGCAVESTCPFSAMKQYLGKNTGWPTSVISSDPSYEARLKALQEGPYGLCVFHSDNDVVDHQVVNYEFAGGITASFTMCAFTAECNRTIKLMGTEGEIRGHTGRNEITITRFDTGRQDVLHLPSSADGHGGGDYGTMRSFVRQVREGIMDGLTSAEVSAQSHLMAFAAEDSRLSGGQVIDLREYAAQLRARASALPA